MDKLINLSLLQYFKGKFDEAVNAALANKVDKAEGMGLSSNDYTTVEKEKLAGLENYTLPTASSTVLGGVKVGAGLAVDASGVVSATGGGTADSVAWDNVTNKPSDLVYDADLVPYATTAYVDGKVSGVYNFKGSVATYADLANISGATAGDVYNVLEDNMNYACLVADNNAVTWDPLGATVDLSGYVQTSDIQFATTAEIDAMFA